MVTWAITLQDAGNHYHVEVRRGIEGQRALLGRLAFSTDDWTAALAGIAKTCMDEIRTSVRVVLATRGICDGGDRIADEVARNTAQVILARIDLALVERNPEET